MEEAAGCADAVRHLIAGNDSQLISVGRFIQAKMPERLDEYFAEFTEIQLSRSDD